MGLKNKNNTLETNNYKHKIDLKNPLLRPSILITYEGGDLVGKGTQIKLLVERLKSIGLNVNAEHYEPGSTLKAEIIRMILKNKQDTEFVFPGDFINTFDLELYQNEFENEPVPAIAKTYIQLAMSTIGIGVKYDLLEFLLTNSYESLKDPWSGNKRILSLKQIVEDAKQNGTAIEERRMVPRDQILSTFFTKEKLDPQAQAYLFFAARNFLYSNVIKKLLRQYDVVILDRSKDSTAVYQGYAQDINLLPWIRENNMIATEGIVADKTIALYIPIEEQLRRKKNRDAKRGQEHIKDFFDEKEQGFHDKVRNGYLAEEKYYASLPADNPEHNRIASVSGVGDEKEVFSKVWKKLYPIIEKKYPQNILKESNEYKI